MPSMQLKEVAYNLWEVNQRFRIAGVNIGHRMTVVRLPSDELVLHSPVAWNDQLMAEVQKLGRVRHIVVPSLMHDLFLFPYRHAFPRIQFHGPHGIERQVPQIVFQPLEPESNFSEQLFPQFIFGMPRVLETVFFHRESKTLIVADLIFNLLRGDFWTRFIAKLNGSFGNPGPTRLFKFLIKDPEAFHDSIDRIIGLKFDRIIVGHGDIVATDGRELIRQVFNQPASEFAEEQTRQETT